MASRTATLQETRSRCGVPRVDPVMVSSTTTGPPMMARWTAQGAVVASEPLVPVASASSPMVMRRAAAYEMA